MAKKGTLIRPLTRKECPWLERDLPRGKVVYAFTGYTYGCVGDGGEAVSDKPDKDPFYEVPSDALSWNKTVNVLILPANCTRVAQLRAKLAEYKQRLERASMGNDKSRSIGSICKIAILVPLLADGHVDINVVREKISEYPEILGRLRDAFEVIADYCKTGGANVHGGTGLKDPATLASN